VDEEAADRFCSSRNRPDARDRAPSRLGSVTLEILRRNSVTSTLLGEISEYAAPRYDNLQVSPPLAWIIKAEVNGKGTTMKTDRT